MGNKSLLLSFLTASIALPTISAGQKQDSRPNVLFIVADDLGKGDLACYGNKIVKTPNIDRLAHEGIQLDHYRCAAPISGPSRVSILTGRYSERSGYRMNHVEKPSSLDEPWLAVQLRDNGYATAAFGKWHLGDNNFKGRGFDYWTITSPGGWADYFSYNILSSEHPRSKSDGTYATDFLTDNVINYIDKSASTPEHKPFFIYLAYTAPHFPLQVPDDEVVPYKNRGLTPGAEIVYGMVTRLDKEIGRVLEKLKQTGLDKKTLVVFVSDNGPYFGVYEGKSQVRWNCELAGSKEYMLEGGINVPCIVRFPNRTPWDGKMFQSSMHATDWAATILEYVGVTPKGKKLDGVSYLSALQGKTDAPAIVRQFCYNKAYLTDASNAAIIDGKWKLNRPILDVLNRWDNRGKVPENITPTKWQLFDLSKDPDEKNDLADHNKARVKKMIAAFDKWWKEVLTENEAISGPAKTLVK